MRSPRASGTSDWRSVTSESPPFSAHVIGEFRPNWCLFWSGSVRRSQLEIWLPYLRRSRYRYAIAASGDLFPAGVRARVEKLPNVLLLQSFEEAKPWLRQTKGFRGFLYISSKPPNFSVVTRFGGYLHVWLGHGESGKASSAFRSASMYDSVLVAHYDAVQRFPRAIRRWVGGGACAIGVPIVEGAVSDPWPVPRQIRTILYAPTWEGYRDNVDYSSVPEFAPLLTEALPRLLADGVKVIVRPHRGIGNRRPEYLAMIEGLIAAGATESRVKKADFAEADVMISDVSGVVGEFLFTQKPVAMPTSTRLFAITSNAELAREYPWVYRWPVGGLDLAGQLAGLASADPLRGAREVAADRLFGGHRSLEAAAATFDLALDSARFRRSRLSPRLAFETRRRLSFLRNRFYQR
ncbi:MAG: CDP-glycerol glycerophosphotransferase family protein [Chloroflexi bacterium]|nr:CDP-glycerol glycerophosphotransferase family protein [Chloroflexota bacterium]